jgi:transposase-like protein
MTKTEQTRLSSWRLKVLQRSATSSRNVARTCRHFGLSRQAFYKWKRRHAEHGDAGPSGPLTGTSPGCFYILDHVLQPDRAP